MKHASQSARFNLIRESTTPPDDMARLVNDLFDAHATSVVSYLHCLTGEWECANDLTQESFLDLFRTRQRLTNVENPRAWLFRIATHKAYAHLRRRKRFAWLPWSSQDEPRASWTGLEDQLGDALLVERALSKLTTDYRTPLVLFDAYGFSTQEIADTLQISEGAVRVRLHRARQMFRQAYEQSNA